MQSDVLDALKIIYSTLTSNINSTMIVSIVGIVLSSCIALYLTWFGIHKLFNSISAALYGRLSLEFNSFQARKWYKKEGYKHYNSYEEYRDHYNSKYGLEEGFIK